MMSDAELTRLLTYIVLAVICGVCAGVLISMGIDVVQWWRRSRP